MVQAMDQGAMEDVIFVQAMHQRAVEGATDGASYGSESNRLSDGCCKLWIYGCYKRLIRLKS